MGGCGGAREYWRRDEEMNVIKSKPFSPPSLTPWADALHVHAPSKPTRNSKLQPTEPLEHDQNTRQNRSAQIRDLASEPGTFSTPRIISGCLPSDSEKLRTR